MLVERRTDTAAALLEYDEETIQILLDGVLQTASRRFRAANCMSAPSPPERSEKHKGHANEKIALSPGDRMKNMRFAMWNISPLYKITLPHQGHFVNYIPKKCTFRNICAALWNNMGYISSTRYFHIAAFPAGYRIATGNGPAKTAYCLCFLLPQPETEHLAMPPKTVRPKQKVLVLEKAFRIQELLMRYPQGITLTEAVAELKMSKSTIFRILDTLKDIGYVLQSKETGRYSLGYKYQLLANAAGPYGGLKDISRPHLTEFAFTVGQMCHCTIRDGDEGVVVYRVQGKETGVIRIASYVGMRFALHSSAQGKILLSALPEEEVRAIVRRTGLPALTANTITDVEMLLRELENVRVRGYAVDEMEMQDNVRCIGVPAYDASAKAIAAVSVTGTEFDITRDKIPGLVAEARKCAAKISTALGYTG